MKHVLLLTLFLTGALMAETRLSYQEYTMLNPSNQKPSIQLKAKHAMQRIAQVDTEKATQIATQACGNDTVEAVDLRREGWYLRYHVAGCDIRVNALDGTVITNQ